jgi:hypothetical protein
VWHKQPLHPHCLDNDVLYIEVQFTVPSEYPLLIQDCRSKSVKQLAYTDVCSVIVLRKLRLLKLVIAQNGYYMQIPTSNPTASKMIHEREP